MVWDSFGASNLVLLHLFFHDVPSAVWQHNLVFYINFQKLGSPTLAASVLSMVPEHSYTGKCCWLFNYIYIFKQVNETPVKNSIT